MFQTVNKVMLVTLMVISGSKVLAFGSGTGVPETKNNPEKLEVKGELSIRIENLTTNQVMSPPVIKISGPTYTYEEDGEKISHRIFSLNTKSSPELENLAEEGDTSGFKAGDFLAIGDAPILPGEESTINVKLPFYRFGASLSLISMLANTNDAFVGLDFFRLERTSGFGTVLLELEVGEQLETYAKVYDAGTEYNSELCAHIPGPKCGSPDSKPDLPSEGVVSVHPGLRLNGDLSPEFVFSPLAGAKITIVRTK